MKFNIPLLFTNAGAPLKDVCVTVTEQGMVLSIAEGFSEDGKNINGVVVPGLVNAHCHLELSHLKNKIVPLTDGMSGFLRQLFNQRFSASEGEAHAAMQDADRSMWKQGIIAVGDVSNFSASLRVKEQSEIHYHTFIELAGLNPAKAEELVAASQTMVDAFKADGLACSLSPHAPYSVSMELYRRIFSGLGTEDPMTFHIHESTDELDFFAGPHGALYALFADMGFSLDTLDMVVETGRPLPELLHVFPPLHRLQLVHNTVTLPEEMEMAVQSREGLYWCLCPAANVFITGMLPSVESMYRHGLKMTLGTDSLASNTELSLVAELRILARAFPEIPFGDMLQWATVNGAEFLGLPNEQVTIREGQKCTLVNVIGVNPDAPHWSQAISSERLQ